MKNKFLPLVFITFFLYLFSLFLLTSYTGGDQVHYVRLYDALASSHASDVMDLAMRHVNSYEPVYAYLFWAGARLGIEKITFVSILNVILLLGLIILMRQNKVNWFIQVLMLANFYVLVLMTGAERLKISYILLVFAAITRGNIRIFFALASPFAHLQSFILLGGFVSAKIGSWLGLTLSRMKIRKRMPLFLVYSVPIAVFAFTSLYYGLARKASSYIMHSGGFAELPQLSILAFLGIIASRDRISTLFMFATMSIAVFFLGGDRVNMIAITLYLYLMARQERVQHPIVITFIIYFALKSFPFIYNVLRYGDGFIGEASNIMNW